MQSSRLLACNFTKNELLHKSFQGFFLDYQNILFPEQLFMGHSWQRVSNTAYVLKNPLYCLPTFFKFCPTPLSVASNFQPPAIFHVLFLWLNGWPCRIWCVISLNPIQDGHFRGCLRIGGEAKRAPVPLICHIYPTMLKLDTVIPYLKKIQKIYQSLDTPLDFWWHQHFFVRNQQILLYQEIQI